jgi:hypothetical protein
MMFHPAPPVAALINTTALLTNAWQRPGRTTNAPGIGHQHRVGHHPVGFSRRRPHRPHRCAGWVDCVKLRTARRPTTSIATPITSDRWISAWQGYQQVVVTFSEVPFRARPGPSPRKQGGQTLGNRWGQHPSSRQQLRGDFGHVGISTRSAQTGSTRRAQCAPR